MLHFTLKLTALFIILFAGIVGLIHSQPADDGGLREILLPTCAAPCFLGIHPGQTSGEAAFALLNNHPWVTNVSFTEGDAQDGTLSWSWTGAQPPVLRTPFLIAGEIKVLSGVVDSIRLRTAISYGAIWLLLGWPANGWIQPSQAYLRQYDNHVAVYPALGLEFRSLVKHPLRVEPFWSALVDIYFEMNPPENYHYVRPCWWGCP